MEINPYSAVPLTQAAISGNDNPAADQTKTEAQPESFGGQDRVEVVLAQNLASIETDFFDVETAFGLLDQMEQDFANLSPEDLAGFFRYDHLRMTFSR